VPNFPLTLGLQMIAEVERMAKKLRMSICQRSGTP
jgi:hypothetical protein